MCHYKICRPLMILVGLQAWIVSSCTVQVYMADGLGRKELFCISAIIGGGQEFTVVLGANFHRAYYTVYEYDARTDTAKVRRAPVLSNATHALKDSLFLFLQRPILHVCCNPGS